MASWWSESDPCWMQDENLATGREYQNIPGETILSSAATEKLQLSKVFGEYLLVFMILVSVTISIKKLYGSQLINPSRLA